MNDISNTLKRNKVTIAFSPKMYNPNLVMEKHQTDPVEQCSTKPLVCYYQIHECHERQRKAGLGSGLEQSNML
jgi:hypothetical protein